MPPSPYVSLSWPAAGLIKRFGYENKSPYSSPAISNCRPDETAQERARGGSRPALTTAPSTGAANQLLTDLLWVNSGTLTNTVIRAASGSMAVLSGGGASASGVSLRSDIQLSSIDYRQKLFVAGDNTSNHQLVVYDPASGSTVAAPSSSGAVSITARGDSGNAHSSGGGNDMRFTVAYTSGTIADGSVVKFAGITGTNATAWNYATNGSIAYQITQNDVNHFDVTDPAAPVYSAGTTLSGATGTQVNGSIPIKCRIVLRHNDRLWLGWDEANPHEWYASAVGDALNFDYSADTIGAAVSGTNSDAGQIGEPIKAMISHSNLCLIFGCDSSLWILRGDPATGGSISNLSRRIGILDRFSWCHDPTGALWFISRDGLYTLPPGCFLGAAPTQVSRDKIPLELVHIDPSLNQVTMGYDTQHQGIYIFVSPTTPGTASHWWFSPKTQSFWPMALNSANDPFTVCSRRSYTAPTITESTTWLGCRDGSIRRFDESSASDTSGGSISSYIDFGPFPLGPPGMDGILAEVQLTNSSSTTGTITVDVRVGESAEAAFNASAFESHAMSTAGLNYTWRPMARGHAAVVRVNGTGEWGFEELIVKRLPAGPRRIV